MVVALGHLVVVASLVVEHRLWVHGLQELQHSGTVLAAHGLSHSVASRIFSDQELNPSLLLWQVHSLLSSPRGSSFLSLACIFQAVI